MHKTISCKAALALLLAACLVMAVASRPLANRPLGASSSAGLEPVLQPPGTSPVTPKSNRSVPKLYNQLSQKAVVALVKSSKTEKKAATGP
ncbi:hypothetical protein OEZ86_012460 [Tetradesmus obliquus]|nr:hypothetical protein OEZ86_012460 [Tetradesmus obliquus]